MIMEFKIIIDSEPFIVDEKVYRLFEKMGNDVRQSKKQEQNLIEKAFLRAYSLGFTAAEVDGNSYVEQCWLAFKKENNIGEPPAPAQEAEKKCTCENQKLGQTECDNTCVDAEEYD